MADILSWLINIVVKFVVSIAKPPFDAIYHWLGLPPTMYNVLYNAYIRLVLGLVGFILFGIDLLAIIYMERKIIGRMHNRRSVTETGPFGFFQNIADVLKMLIKEDVYPRGADRFLHFVIPFLVASLPIIAYAIIPFGPGIYLARIQTGLLLILAISSLTPGLIILAGWISNSKYPKIAAFRTGMQMVSYEIPLVLSAISVAIIARSFDLETITQMQSTVPFIVLNPIAALVFFIAMAIEFERSPFDIPEAEGELLVGWRTEYSGLKFGLFYGLEYFKLFLGASIFTVLFLGGYHGYLFLGDSILWFLIKVHFMIFMAIWVRITFYRPRPDQLLKISYEKLIPLAVASFIISMLVVYIMGAL